MGLFKKLYLKKEKLKPSWLKKAEPSIPLALGVINPVAGLIAGALHTARMGITEGWDAPPGAAETSQQAFTTPTTPAGRPLNSEGSQYVGGSAGGGGVPMQLFTQLGQGLRQQTAAVRTLAAKNAGRRGGLRSAAKRRSTKKTTKKKRRARASAKRGGKFVKGSAAAKRHMAKLRRMRKK